MIGDNDDTEDNDLDEVEAEEKEVDDDAMVDSAHEATVVDADVESLVAKMDNTDQDEAARKRAIRRRLEEMKEERESDLDSTFNFNIDDEI